MKILAFIFTIVLGLTTVHKQIEPLNKLDGDGKKDGKWIVYLDNNWKHIDDSTNAIYYRYTFYSHGTNLNPMGPCGGKGWKLESTNSNNNGYCPSGIKKGEIYTIESISLCICGKGLLHLEETPHLAKWCGITDIYMGVTNAFHSERFEPIVDNFAESLLERLTKEFIEEQQVLI